MSEQMKRCQYCGEEILEAAKKCKHCGSDLEPGASDEAAKPVADYGMFLLAIPVVTTMLILFWVSGMNLLQSPGDTMTLLMLATVLGTAIVAAMEASKVGMKSDRTQGTYSATAWFFIITLLWIIGYPAYLYKRRHYGLTNHLLAGMLMAFIFVGSFLGIGGAISRYDEEINAIEGDQKTSHLAKINKYKQSAAGKRFIKSCSIAWSNDESTMASSKGEERYENRCTCLGYLLSETASRKTYKDFLGVLNATDSIIDTESLFFFDSEVKVAIRECKKL